MGLAIPRHNEVLVCSHDGGRVQMHSWLGVTGSDEVLSGINSREAETWILEAKYMLDKPFSDKRVT